MYIQILALFFFFQSMVACQQAPLSDENTVHQLAGVGLQDLELAPPGTTNAVFQSSDGGQTWRDVSAGLPKGFAAYSVLVNGKEILLGAETGLYRGIAASDVPVWRKDFYVGQKISELFPGRAGLYASCYNIGFSQEVLPGIWAPRHQNLIDKTVCAVFEAPDGAMLVGTNTGIYKSVDNGKSWKQVFEEGAVFDLVEKDGVMIAGSFRGLLRSTDGGDHWSWVLNEGDESTQVVQIKDGFVGIVGGGKAIAKGITNRLRLSTDGGNTWHRMDESLFPVQDMLLLDEHLEKAKYVNDFIQVDQSLFCSFDTGIYRSDDHGKTWKLTFPIHDKSNYRLAASGNVIYVVRTFGC